MRFFLDSTAVNCSYFFLGTATLILILRFLCEAQRVQSCCSLERNVQNAGQTTLIGGVLPKLTPARVESRNEICWLGALIGKNRHSSLIAVDCSSQCGQTPCRCFSNDYSVIWRWHGGGAVLALCHEIGELQDNGGAIE